MAVLHEHCLTCFDSNCARDASLFNCCVVPCPNFCGVRLHDCKLLEHMSATCARSLVACPNAEYGCARRVQRKHIASHLSSCPASILQCPLQMRSHSQCNLQPRYLLPDRNGHYSCFLCLVNTVAHPKIDCSSETQAISDNQVSSTFGNKSESVSSFWLLQHTVTELTTSHDLNSLIIDSLPVFAASFRDDSIQTAFTLRSALRSSIPLLTSDGNFDELTRLSSFTSSESQRTPASPSSPASATPPVLCVVQSDQSAAYWSTVAPVKCSFSSSSSSSSSSTSERHCGCVCRRGEWGAHVELAHVCLSAVLEDCAEQHCPLWERGCPFFVRRLEPGAEPTRLRYLPALDALAVCPAPRTERETALEAGLQAVAHSGPERAQPAAVSASLSQSPAESETLEGSEARGEPEPESECALLALPESVLERIVGLLDSLSLRTLTLTCRSLLALTRSQWLASKYACVEPVWRKGASEKDVYENSSSTAASYSVNNCVQPRRHWRIVAYVRV